MTGPDRSKLPHGILIPVPEGTLSLNTSQLGTLHRFPPKFDPIFTLCGRIILEWSMAEDELMFLILRTWRNEIVPGIEDLDRPKSLKKKLAYLRKAFRPDGPLGDISDEVRNVLKFVSQTANRRHDVAHLNLSSIKEIENDYILEMYSLEGRSIAVKVSQLKGLLADVYETQNALLAVSWNHSALIHKVAPPR